MREWTEQEAQTICAFLDGFLEYQITQREAGAITKLEAAAYALAYMNMRFFDGSMEGIPEEQAQWVISQAVSLGDVNVIEAMGDAIEHMSRL